MSIELYTDGGCAGANPSKVGIAWAFCVVEREEVPGTSSWGNPKYIVLHKESGALTKDQCGKFSPTNNLAEMIAAVRGLEYCKRVFPDAPILLFSDSELTLKRLFEGYSMEKLPKNVQQRAWDVTLHFNGRLGKVLVKGHPTKKELSAGQSKDGKYPVSEFNVLADKLCKEECKKLLLGKGD
jgi:ribonuclease HI